MARRVVVRAPYMGLAEMLVDLRGSMSQIDMAELTGISAGFLCDVEKGKRGISGPMAEKVEEALELSPIAASKLQKEAARYAGFKV
jgi:transcriptional regulator with XRE-family HTH domain